VRAAGRAAFEARDAAKTEAMARVRRDPRLDRRAEVRFRANRAAWEFFNAQPPGYRRMAAWFVMSAKRDETRLKRLDTLISISASQRRLVPMAPSAKKV
jgi:uncharacterized protein YdeI (YjbR/CyaY-like superfamily)